MDEEAKAVLVVEDDPTVAHLVGLTLDSYRVEVATTATEARSHLSGGAWDLVILDVNLPGSSGLEVLREMRGDLGLDTPVLMLTAQRDEAFRSEASELGANAYLTKPFSPGELREQVGALVPDAR